MGDAGPLDVTPHADRFNEVIYLIDCKTAAGSGRLEMWWLVGLMGLMANACTASIDWKFDPRIMTTLLRGNEILFGT
jgi:hypothetical protein